VCGHVSPLSRWTLPFGMASCLTPRNTPVKGRGPSIPQIWGFVSICVYTLCRRTTNFGVVTHGEGRVSWGQPRLPSQESGVQALRNFCGSPVFMLTPFNKFGIVTHMGRGVFFLGQPRHCVCTNAWHGLSAVTAEFFCFYCVD